MKESLLHKLDTISERYDELGALLSDQEIIGDQKKFRAFSQEYAEIESVVKCFQQYRAVQEEIAEAELLVKDEDPEMREMVLRRVREVATKTAESNNAEITIDIDKG